MGNETGWLDRASGLPNEPPDLPNQAERTPERIICIFVIFVKWLFNSKCEHATRWSYIECSDKSFFFYSSNPAYTQQQPGVKFKIQYLCLLLLLLKSLNLIYITNNF